MILSPEMPEDHDLEDERFLEIYSEATDIYGLMHARYITTSKGKITSIIKVLQSWGSYFYKADSDIALAFIVKNRMQFQLVFVRIWRPPELK